MPLKKKLMVKKKQKLSLWECENVPRTKSAKFAKYEKKYNHKTIQFTQSPTNRKVYYTLFACYS